MNRGTMTGDDRDTLSAEKDDEYEHEDEEVLDSLGKSSFVHSACLDHFTFMSFIYRFSQSQR